MPDLLIPVRKCDTGGGYCQVSDRVNVSSIHREDRLPIEQIIGDLDLMGINGRYMPGAKQAHITLSRDRSVSHSEGYRLTITPQRVEIVAKTDTGAFYGAQTLRELLRMGGRKLQCRRIEDWPTFLRRGVYLDCARGKVPKVSTIRQLIDRLAQWKYNELQLYIENAFVFDGHPDIGKGYSPFRAEDILEIQEYCKQYHIRLVPSLSSLGHFEKILMLKKYSHLGEMPGYRGYVGGTTLCPTDPRSLDLIADLYADFLPLFEAEDFNVCGDEPWELGRGRSSSRAKRIGVGGIYYRYIMKLRDLCLKYGKRMNMWGDIALKYPEMISEIPRDVVMLNWDYEPDGKSVGRTHEISKAGLPLVCCPGTHGWLSNGTRLRQSMMNISQFAGMAEKHRAEGLLNTDWGDCEHRNTMGVSLCALAHGAAHAWNTQGVEDKKHLRNFTFHVFGDRSGRLAKVLKTIGAEEYGYWAYHAPFEKLTLRENIAGHGPWGGVVIDDVPLTSRKVESILQSTKMLDIPTISETMPTFETIAIEEFLLANRMNRLALHRLQLARIMRAGQKPASGALKRHLDEIETVSSEFTRIWRLRNRPSRLKDNLKAFRKIAEETKSHIG